jgi:hypothetical protein
VTYISSAELARRCDVTRAAVAIAIKEQRINAKYVRRAGGKVLVEEGHGLSVLGHHKKTKTPPSPAPAAVAAPAAANELADFLAWGSAPFEADEPDELTGAAEVGDLEDQIEEWNQLVSDKERVIKKWEMAYHTFREWITAEAAKTVMQHLKENQIARNAVCEAIAVVQSKLREELDEVHYQSGLR